MDATELHLGSVLSGSPLEGLLAQGQQPLCHALPSVDHKANFRLQPANFGARLIQAALGLVDLVTGSVMGLAHRLQLGFNLAQISQLAIQRHAGALGFGLHLGLFCAGLATAQKPQLLLLERGLCTDRLVALRHLSLPVELFQVGIEFAQDVFHPGQVLPGVRQPVLGLAAAFFVFGNSGGLF